MSKLKDSIPKKADDILTSVSIDRKLYARLKVKLKKEGHNFHKLIDAAAKQYLGES